MKIGMNKVIIQGTLIFAPTLRKTPSGTSVINLIVDAPSGYFDGMGKYIERNDIIEVTVFGKRGEAMKDTLKIDDVLNVFGRVGSREYKERYYSSIIADTVEVIGHNGEGKTEKKKLPKDLTEPPESDSESDSDLPW